jgi:hypothetical protein
MPINVLVMLVFKVRLATVHQESRMRTERIEFASGQSAAAFGGITVRGSHVGRNAANPQ